MRDQMAALRREGEKQPCRGERIEFSGVDVMGADEQRPRQSQSVQHIGRNSERVAVAVVRHEKHGARMALRLFDRFGQGGQRQDLEIALERLGDCVKRVERMMVALDARVVDPALDTMEVQRDGAPETAQRAGRKPPRQSPQHRRSTRHTSPSFVGSANLHPQLWPHR